MKMKRKGLAAAAAAVVLLGLLIADERLQTRANTAMQEQEAVYMTYQQLLTNAAEASVTVTEGGAPVGSYSLEQMGVLQAVQDAASVQFYFLS